MSDQILARYGHMDRALATVVRTSIHSVLVVVVVRLEEAHRKLVDLSDDQTKVYLPDDHTPDRLLVLMLELFGIEHIELLDHDLDPAFAQQVMSAAGDDPVVQRIVSDVFAAVSLFLVTEANLLRQCVDYLPEEITDEEIAGFETLACEIFALSLTLNREVEERSWLHLPERAAHTDEVAETPLTEVAAAARETEKSAVMRAGVVPTPRSGFSEDCSNDPPEYLDEEAIWEQLQRAYKNSPDYLDHDLGLDNDHGPSDEHIGTAEDDLEPVGMVSAVRSSPEAVCMSLVRANVAVDASGARSSVRSHALHRRIRPAGPWIRLALTCTMSAVFIIAMSLGIAPPVWAVALVPLWHISVTGLYGLTRLPTPEERFRVWVDNHKHGIVAATRESVR
ncbi:hypothetical protein ACGFQG_32130 [Nocardia fluminea]|uniref:hypothetical protein n=1 Tax=Nocardia fluminea TaxID=134984 RepID=UPI0037123893